MAPGRPIITLYRGPHLWMAGHRGQGSDFIRHLFDTTELPTPYGIVTPASVVHRAIGALNPTKAVLLEATEPETL